MTIYCRYWDMGIFISLLCHRQRTIIKTLLLAKLGNLFPRWCARCRV